MLARLESKGALGVDIYDYLSQDHRKVADLIEQAMAINILSVQHRLFEDIKAELTLHAEAEERTFYTALKEAMAANPDWQLSHSVHDHDEIRTFLAQLTSEGITSPKWMLFFGELKHAVEHHVEEEEGRLFELGRRFIPQARAEQLAKEMDALKARLMAERGIRIDHINDA